MEFKDTIYLLRVNNDLSLAQLASEFNKSESAIRAWESGRTKPDADTLIALSKRFNCSIDFLLGNSEYVSPDKELEWKEHEHDFLDLLDKLPHHLQSPWVLNLQKLTEIMIDNNFKKYNSYIIILMMDILRNYTALIQTFGYMDTFDDVASELYNNVEYTLLQQKRTNDKLLNLLKAIIVNNQPNNKDITILQKAFHERCLSDTDIIKKSNKFNSINTSLDK